MNSHLRRVLVTFDESLGRAFKTRLVGGFTEPEYIPPKIGAFAEIRFREDFLSSALHEVAHWCIAGDERRSQHDFGYWYWPEGRDADQQLAFEKAEIRPQALEWIFANACGHEFHLSRDNHGPSGQQTKFDFAAAVSRQAQEFCLGELPERAAIFADALAQEFDRPQYSEVEPYVEDLGC